MRFAYWIPKATSTHSDYVIAICFFMTTVIARTRHSVTFKRTLPVLLLLYRVVHKVCAGLQSVKSLLETIKGMKASP
jgi:hypothetical protein